MPRFRGDCNVKKKALTCVIIVLLLVATAFRWVMSQTLHMWYAFAEAYDDQLLMSYSWSEHFTGGDNYVSLAKSPGYGYWLLVAWRLGLSADNAQFLLWLIAAALSGVAFFLVFVSII